MIERPQKRMTLRKFASVLPQWYIQFMINSDYYCGYIRLLNRLPAKAKRCGYLEIEDLSAIADWGGNDHGIKETLKLNNRPGRVVTKTMQAFCSLDNPGRAIRAILDLTGWGLTYGSKTLMFMNPDKYAILDSWIRNCLKAELPSIRDGDVNSMVCGYSRFLEHCSTLQNQVADPGPGPNGDWRVSDIQQALFQYAQQGGVIVRPQKVATNGARALPATP